MNEDRASTQAELTQTQPAQIDPSEENHTQDRRGRDDSADKNLALCVRGLTVHFDATPVVQDVSFDADRGEWIGVVGPNGSGKTTLLRAISGAVASSGDVELFGRPLTSWRSRERARLLAVVRQQPQVSFDLSVRDLVTLGRAPHRGWLSAFSADDRETVESALRDADAAAYADRSIQSISGGEVQRAFLAQALAQDARLYLLDEPTTHLDVHYQFSLLDTMRRQVDAGRTVLAVVHDLEHAARYADRLLVLEDGCCVAMGAPGDVLTPSLIADVFGMKASVRSVNGYLRIDYDGPA